MNLTNPRQMVAIWALAAAALLCLLTQIIK